MTQTAQTGGLAEPLRSRYLSVAKQCYTDGQLTIEEFETVVNLILDGETDPRAFREQMKAQYGIDRLDWMPDNLFEGCRMFV